MPLPYTCNTHKKDNKLYVKFLSFLRRLLLTAYCIKSGLWESERNGHDMKLT